MSLPARGRLVCVPVPAVLNCLRPLSDPLALPHIFILTSFVISLVPSRNFPRVDQLLRVLAPGSPLCVARGGNLTAELAYGNHPSVAPHAIVVHQNICADVVHGRALVLGSASDIRGSRVPPLAVVLKPKFRINHDLTLRARAATPSLTTIPIFPPPPPASSVMCFEMCCYGCCFGGRSTVPQLESSLAALT